MRKLGLKSKKELQRKESVRIHNTEPARIQQHDIEETEPKYDGDITKICNMIPSFCVDLFNMKMFKKLIELPSHSAEYIKSYIDHNTTNELFAIHLSHITVRSNDDFVEFICRMHLYDLRKYPFTKAEDVTLEKISTNQFGPAALECAMFFQFYKNAFDKGTLVHRESRMHTGIIDRETDLFVKRMNKWSEKYLDSTNLSDKYDRCGNSYLNVENADTESLIQVADDSKVSTASEIISKEKVEEFFAEEGALTFLKNADIDKFLETVFTALKFQIHNLMRTENMQAGKYNLTPPDLFDILKIVKEPNKFTVVRKGE